MNSCLLKRVFSKRKVAAVIVCSMLATQFCFTQSISASDKTLAAADPAASGVVVTNPKVAVGVISDVHLTDGGEATEDTNLKNALTKFKENKINVLMVAGDIGNSGQAGAYKKFNDIFNAVYSDPATAPKKVLVMGNHDYWNGSAADEAQKNFTTNLGTDSVNTSIVVNGYHFIGVSTEDGTTNGTFTDKSTKWLKQELEKAVQDDPNKPIFVTCHQHISNTVYGSDAWGNPSLDEVLKDYPQVITFSGHSHYVLNDERSIYQKDYTSCGTATLSYTELEGGKEGGSVPVNANQVAQGLIVKADDSNVVITRWDFHHDEQIKDNWVIPQPADKSKFTYTDARIAASKAPYFADGSKITIVHTSDTSCKISCDSAKAEDIVQSYKVEAVDPTNNYVVSSKLYFSDFYLGIPYMTQTQKFSVPGLKANKTYKINVYGINSFGKLSDPLSTTITTTNSNNTPAADILNVNFTKGASIDDSTFSSPAELKGNAKIDTDAALNNKKVLVLDGNGSYVNYTTTENQLSQITDSFTLECIFKMNTIKNQAIIENCQSSGIGFESTDSGLVELWARINGAYTRVGVQLDKGKYYDLVATYDGSKVNLYLDGQLVKTQSASGSVTYTDGIAMCLGGDPEPAGKANITLDGNIALARISNKAISADDVLKRYDDFYGITPTPSSSTPSSSSQQSSSSQPSDSVPSNSSSSAPSQSNNNGNPKTSDNGIIPLVVMMLFASGAAVALVKSKKK